MTYCEYHYNIMGFTMKCKIRNLFPPSFVLLSITAAHRLESGDELNIHLFPETFVAKCNKN